MVNELPNEDQASISKNGGSKTLIWLLIILILLVIGLGVYYFLFFSKNNQGGTISKSTTTATPTSATATWKTYSITAAAEEAAEQGSAVAFSIKYPNDWNYKVLNAEDKAQGAGTTLHDIAFDTYPANEISAMGARLRIMAEAKTLDSEVNTILSTYSSAPNNVKKTEGTAGGQRMVKLTDVSMTDGSNLPVFVFIQSPGSWILTIEAGTKDNSIITQMVQSLKFL